MGFYFTLPGTKFMKLYKMSVIFYLCLRHYQDWSSNFNVFFLIVIDVKVLWKKQGISLVNVIYVFALIFSSLCVSHFKSISSFHVLWLIFSLQFNIFSYHLFRLNIYAIPCIQNTITIIFHLAPFIYIFAQYRTTIKIIP